MPVNGDHACSNWIDFEVAWPMLHPETSYTTRLQNKWLLPCLFVLCSIGRATLHTKRWRLWAQRYYLGLKVYMDAYMTNCKYCFTVFALNPSPTCKPNTNSNKPCQTWALDSWCGLWVRSRALTMTRSNLEVPKYPRRALHLSGSEARFGGGG